MKSFSIALFFICLSTTVLGMDAKTFTTVNKERLEHKLKPLADASTAEESLQDELDYRLEALKHEN